MAALSEDAVADLYRLVAELEQRLESSFAAHDEAIARQTATAQENVQLRNELSTARERQNASAEILRVISTSPTDMQPVFDAIVLASVRLLGCDRAFFLRCDRTTYSRVAMATPEGLLAAPANVPIDPNANFPSRAIVEKKTLHLPDWSLIDLPEHERFIHESFSVNSALYLPLLREAECIGLLVLAGKRPGMFGESEIALAESFRDQALIAIENVQLFSKRQEALERQTATAEILRVIASSPSDVQPVFEAIAQRSNRLIEGLSTAVYSIVDGTQYLMAFTRSNPEADAALQAWFPRPLSAASWGDRIRNGEIVQIPDFEATVEWAGQPALREMARLRGFRGLLFVPLRRDGATIGTINVTRKKPGAFTDHHVQLLRTFADQAVIAIENTRLFNETKEALERQTATADILKVIASSPSDTTPVFEAIAASANRLLGGFSAAVFRFRDGTVHLAAFTPVSLVADAALRADFPKAADEFEPFELARHGKPFPIPDTEEIPYAPIKEIARLHGFRSMLFVPLMNGGVPIGIISVTRLEPGAFAPHHVQLLQTFADQAVIAIENARLFNETQKALERQTATADILNVIASSPTDVQPVFDAIADSARRLLGGQSALVTRVAGDRLDLAAHTVGSEAGDEALRGSFPTPLSSSGIHSKVARTGAVAFRADMEAEPDVTPDLKEVARTRGFRSIIAVPMMREGVSIGTIGVSRSEPGPFADNQINLLKTFADQAVIAIQNVRLFNETQEALERQIATSDILRVIASSPSDVQPVFDAIAASAKQLIGGFSGAVFRFIDGAAHLAAFTPTNATADAVFRTSFPRPLDRLANFKLALGGKTVQIADTEAVLGAEPDQVEMERREVARARGFRSILLSPLMNNGLAIGRSSSDLPSRGSDWLVRDSPDLAGREFYQAGRHYCHSKMCDCSTKSSNAPTIYPNPCNSRPPSATSSRPSAARPSTCSRCWIPWSTPRHCCATPRWRSSCAAKATCTARVLPSASPRSTSNSSNSTRSPSTGAPSRAVSRLNIVRYRSPTSPPIPNTP